MSAGREAWENLDITGEEAKTIANALKNDEFRKLLVDYCKEVDDPENRKLYQSEIIELERERGNDVTFINPEPGYVIKTSADGQKKAFVNICSNANLARPSSKPASDGRLLWTIPHSMAQPHEDWDKKRNICKVFDVVFHPEALQLAEKLPAFKDMLNKTACDSIQKNFNVQLDTNNLKFPKLKYKGRSEPTVIRKPSEEPASIKPEERTPFDDFYDEQMRKNAQSAPQNTSKSKNNQPKTPQFDSYTTPNFIIKHRNDIDLQEFTNEPTAKINVTVPKELVVEVDLPLLKSAADVNLDVEEKLLNLVSEKPSKYKLQLTLPYRVDCDNGSARFDTEKRKLCVTLPVKRASCRIVPADLVREDSGVDSDHGSPVRPPLITETTTENTESSSVKEDEALPNNSSSEPFLHSDTLYSLPEHSCNPFDSTLAFTLHVKNADSSSIQKKTDPESNSVHLKFTSVSPSFVASHYAFFVRLPVPLAGDNVAVETWDNNVILLVPFASAGKPVEHYWAGKEAESVEKVLIQEPAVINTHWQREMLNSDDEDDIEDDKAEGNQQEVEVLCEEASIHVQIINQRSEEPNEEPSEEPSEEPVMPVKSKSGKLLQKSRSVSESSCDELSDTSGSFKSKGILKPNRSFRSYSESCVDECALASSFENCIAMSDSHIPEESEGSCSLKKTVRFNDVVHRQIFRINSSILGQRKKNQRKNKNKKKSMERRLSESEASEVDDKRVWFLKEAQKKKPRRRSSSSKKNGSTDSLETAETKKAYKTDMIFDLDM